MRLAFALLTVLPVRRHADPGDRRQAGLAMLWAPVVGVALGALACLVAVVAGRAGLAPLLAAVMFVAALALLTRGLHLDGLADTADGLGSARPADGALEVMRRSDVGPFGVVTLVLLLLAQVAAVAELVAAGAPWAAVVAVVAGRLALPLVCRYGVPAARPDGLGALVAGTVPLLAVAGACLAAVVLAAPATRLAGLGWWPGPLAVLLALLAAEAVLRRCHRRLGGVTGDVLGAVVEVATTVALVVLAATAR